jgi:hypothetical protein
MNTIVSTCGTLIIHPPKTVGSGCTSVNISISEDTVYIDGFPVHVAPEAVEHESPKVSELKKRTKLSAKGKSPYGPQRNK